MRKFIEKDTGTIYTIRELELMFEIATLKHEIDNDDYEDFNDWLDCITDMSGELEEITVQYCVVCRNENDGILAVKYGGRLLDAEYIKEEMVFAHFIFINTFHFLPFRTLDIPLSVPFYFFSSFP